MLWLKSDNSKLALYYILFCVLFIISQVSLISIFSFFHFLLDHEMSVIENWLNRNSWEVLVFSKLISTSVVVKIAQLNSYYDISLIEFIKKINYRPTAKVIGMSVFILVLFYALLDQFGGGVVKNHFKQELFYSSFLGAFFFYIFDIIVIYFVRTIYQIEDKKWGRNCVIMSILFLISSKIALPYLDKYFIFLVVHFFTLFYLLYKSKFIDTIVYTLLVISPMSSIYGIDIVWDNAYSIFAFSNNVPHIGIILIWTIALIYFRISKSH